MISFSMLHASVMTGAPDQLFQKRLNSKSGAGASGGGDSKYHKQT